MKRTRRRDDLIQVGRDIVIRQGFNAAGLSDILNTAGVPKGSFYYYFESKEDFGLAIIEDFASKYQKELEAILGNEQFSPLARLNNYFEKGIAEMVASQCENGCLIGNLAQELSAQSEVFRDRLSHILSDWEAHFSQCISAACTSGEIAHHLDANMTAQFILSGWQGAMLRAKVERSIEPLKTFVQILFSQVLRTPIPAKSTAS